MNTKNPTRSLSEHITEALSNVTEASNKLVASSTEQLSDSTKIDSDNIMSADVMKDGKVVELSMYPDATKKFYVSKEYAKAHNIIESVNEAKMSKQDTESFTIDYDNMGGGLNGRIDFQLWGADEIAIELGHYSGGRNIRFKMDSKSAQKLLDAKAKQRKMTADLKIGERIPDEQLAEYMALENELSIELTQNMALDLKNAASAYEKEIAKVLSKYGFKL